MKLDHKKFFDGFKSDFDDSLEQSQVDGIEFLLTAFENDMHWGDIRNIAYALATIYHECAGSMVPVEEGYYLGNEARVKKFQKTLRYFPFFGRGYVQLTWRKNYEHAGKALGIDFIANPDLLLDPQNAFDVLTLGMFEGWFTGKKLRDFIHGSVCDYKNARTIINGHDRAALIAGYAIKFERILTVSQAAPAASTDLQPAGAAEKSADTSSDPQVAPPVTDLVLAEVKTTAIKDEVKTETTAKAGDAVDAPPTQVSQNQSFARWLFSGGTTTAVGTAIWAYMTNNANVIGIAIICVTALIVALVFRGAITDAIRMQTAADPDKKNVT